MLLDSWQQQTQSMIPILKKMTDMLFIGTDAMKIEKVIRLLNLI
jgi:hypothetical protein